MCSWASLVVVFVRRVDVSSTLSDQKYFRHFNLFGFEMLSIVMLGLWVTFALANPFPGAVPVHDEPYASDYNGPNDYGSNGIGAGGLASVGGYDIGYEVNSPKHGNLYKHRETSDNDGAVSGSYSLVEPDGSLRTVDYVADWVNGFRATVRDKHGVRHHGFVSDKSSGSAKNGGNY